MEDVIEFNFLCQKYSIACKLCKCKGEICECCACNIKKGRNSCEDCEVCS